MKNFTDCQMLVLARQAAAGEMPTIGYSQTQSLYENFVSTLLSDIESELSPRQALRTLSHIRIDLTDLETRIESGGEAKKKCADSLSPSQIHCIDRGRTRAYQGMHRASRN